MSTRTINSALFPAVLTLTSLLTCGLVGAASLLEAVQAGDIDATRQLVTAGAAVDMPEPDGTTPLLWAVYNTTPELADLLLQAGADPDIPNTLGLSPLLQASRYGDAAMIRRLLGHGASLEIQGLATEPPLLAAARAGNPEAVRLLLEAGADPNATEQVDQQTALMWAAAEGHLESARLLLEAGADPDRQARTNELTERKNADFPTGGFTALHWAGRNGDEAMIRLLVEHGADINARNGDGSTPMMLAIVNDRFDTASLFIALGADANDGSLYYATVMRDATTDWRAKDGTVYRADYPNNLSALDLTRLLLEAGADPDLVVDMQMHNTSMCCDIKASTTAFYRAAVAADVDGLKLMLGYGADVGWKPAPVVKEGDPAPPADAGTTALMVAITGGNGVGISGGPNDIRQILPPFREAGNRDPYAAVLLLLDAGADVHGRDINQNTPLHIAAKALHPDIVKALVARGADLEAVNKDGETARLAVEKMEVPAPRPGFPFFPPPAQPVEMIALLDSLQNQ
jgi:serine/threonine-protein phosphatase 6 regulatory ankyrin repeat subunit B